jgi:hypothetical protein
MGQWERKGAARLAGAIYSHSAKNKISTNEYFIKLEVVYKEINSASVTVSTDAQELQRLRNRVCEICRKHELYECDLPEGWSINCALLNAND